MIISVPKEIKEEEQLVAESQGLKYYPVEKII